MSILNMPIPAHQFDTSLDRVYGDAMKSILTIGACMLVAGCSTTGKLDNVLVISLTGDRAFVASMYGPIGITAELRAADARELLAMREKTRAAEAALSAAAGRPVRLEWSHP
jgi:hypothetical protein